VRNPLPMALAAPGGTFGIDIADKPFVKSESIPAMRVGSRSTERISLPARFDYGDLLAIATGWKDAGEIPYRLHGALRYTVAGAPLELPFEHRDEVPVLRMPEIEIEDFESSGFSMQDASVSILAEIENPNAFEVGITDLGYAISIGGVRVGDITARTPNRIGSASKGELRLDGRINTIQTIGEILKSRDLGAVQVELTGALDTPFGKVGLPR